MTDDRSIRAEPTVLAYASTPRETRAERAAGVFAAVAVIAVLASGSVAWLLLVQHLHHY